MGKLTYHIKRRLFLYLRRNLAMAPLIWGDKENVSIGRNVSLVDTIFNCRSGRITIEDDVFFGHGVALIAGTHHYDDAISSRQAAVPTEGHDIVVRRGAWVATNAIVIGPCDIGEYAVVGAGALVTGKIEARSLYLGQKARLVRHLDEDAAAAENKPNQKDTGYA